MKVQFSYLCDFKQIDKPHYFLAIPSFEVKNSTETQLANLENLIENANKIAYGSSKFEDLKSQITRLKQNHDFILQNWLHEYLMSEFGDTFFLFDDIQGMIEYLEKEYAIKDKKLKIKIAKIYIMDEETRKPVGEFQYKIHGDML